jgi:hypothetical protein
LIYSDTAIDSLFQLNRHLNFFRALRNQINPNYIATFEFWTWMSLQYRFFAEIVDAAMQRGVLTTGPMLSVAPSTDSNYLVSEFPISLIFGHVAARPIGKQVTQAVVSLQHAGYYYQVAACCMVQRRQCFMRLAPDAIARFTPAQQAAYDAEKAFDFGTATIELFTKAYEQFKKFKSQRMTLFLACEISRAYLDSGKVDMAHKWVTFCLDVDIRFYDKVAKTYRKEQWFAILAKILDASLACTRQLQNFGAQTETLIELASELLTPLESDRVRYQTDLERLLATSPQQKCVIQMDTLASPFIECSARFNKETSFVGMPIAFQVVLTARIAQTPFRIAQVCVHFTNSQFNHVITHKGETVLSADTTTRLVKVEAQRQGAIWTAQANLLTRFGDVCVLQSQLVPSQPQEVKITGVTLVVQGPQYSVDLVYVVKDDVAMWYRFDRTLQRVKPVTDYIPGDRTCVRYFHR